ncbi:hypothetical protein Taro_036211 [Colocasia esculenta]|uniref:Uncharacterized protein n=1 Tax=Colocasia esculenta TaxID=4460 RepID=A0A843WCQ4_COLES|nr:hypothetical protein [Colocasia esculenta]
MDSITDAKNNISQEREDGAGEEKTPPPSLPGWTAAGPSPRRRHRRRLPCCGYCSPSPLLLQPSPPCFRRCCCSRAVGFPLGRCRWLLCVRSHRWPPCCSPSPYAALPPLLLQARTLAAAPPSLRRRREGRRRRKAVCLSSPLLCFAQSQLGKAQTKNGKQRNKKEGKAGAKMQMHHPKIAENPLKKHVDLRGEAQTFPPWPSSPPIIKRRERPSHKGGFLKAENQSKALGRDCKAVWEKVWGICSDICQLRVGVTWLVHGWIWQAVNRKKAGGVGTGPSCGSYGRNCLLVP